MGLKALLVRNQLNRGLLVGEEFIVFDVSGKVLSYSVYPNYVDYLRSSNSPVSVDVLSVLQGVSVYELAYVQGENFIVMPETDGIFSPLGVIDFCGAYVKLPDPMEGVSHRLYIFPEGACSFKNLR